MSPMPVTTTIEVAVSDAPSTLPITMEEKVARFVELKHQIKDAETEQKALYKDILEWLHPEQGVPVRKRVGAHRVEYRWAQWQGANAFRHEDLLAFLQQHRWTQAIKYLPTVDPVGLQALLDTHELESDQLAPFLKEQKGSLHIE